MADPTWVTTLGNLTNGQKWAIRVDETTSGHSPGRTYETIAGDVEIGSYADPDGIVRDKHFTGNTTNSSGVGARHVHFEPSDPDWYGHTVIGPGLDYKSVTVDHSLSTSSKALLISGSDMDRFYMQLHVVGGTDGIHLNGNGTVRLGCSYIHSQYTLPESHSDAIQLVAFAPDEPKIQVWNTKLVAPWNEQNACIQGGVQVETWECFFFGGALHLNGQTNDTHIRSVFTPPSTAFGVAFDESNTTLVDCIEGSWEEVTGLVGRVSESVTETWDLADLGAYPGTPGRVLTPAD